MTPKQIASLHKIIDEKEEKIRKMEADLIRLQSKKNNLSKT